MGGGCNFHTHWGRISQINGAALKVPASFTQTGKTCGHGPGTGGINNGDAVPHFRIAECHSESLCTWKEKQEIKTERRKRQNSYCLQQMRLMFRKHQRNENKTNYVNNEKK